MIDWKFVLINRQKRWIGRLNLNNEFERHAGPWFLLFSTSKAGLYIQKDLYLSIDLKWPNLKAIFNF